MADSHELWIIGNGFNKALAQTDQFSEVAGAINDIANLWSEFNELVGDIKEQLKNDTGQEYSDERVLEFIFTVLHSLESKDIFQHSKYQACFTKLFTKFSHAMSNLLISIADKFFSIEINDLYSKISSLLGGEFLSYWQERRQITPTTLVTTNYDGIVDTIFARDKNGSFSQDGMGDYFRPCKHEKHITECTKHYVNGLGHEKKWRGIGFCFSSLDYLESHVSLFRNHLLHLHGSYKFWRHIDSNVEIKVDKQAINIFQECLSDGWFPIVVFGSPSKKRDTIAKYTILEAYYNAIEYLLSAGHGGGTNKKDHKKDLKKDRIKLVIWGTKLDSDPHLRSLVTSAIQHTILSEVVLLLSSEKSAEEFYSQLTENVPSSAPKPPLRYVDYDSARPLLDVVKEI